MSIVVRYSPQPPASKEQYDKSTELFNSQFGEGFVPDGCEMHVAFVDSNGNVRVSEIWDSREQWQAFGEKLMPIRSCQNTACGKAVRPSVVRSFAVRVKAKAQKLWSAGSQLAPPRGCSVVTT